MACLSEDSTGWRLQFRDHRGTRRSLRLTDMNKRGAQDAKRHVEHILAAQQGNTAVGKSTAEWIASIGDKTRDRLAAIGLVEVQSRATLGQHIDKYKQNTNARQSTRRSWETTFNSLIAYFGKSCDLRNISKGKAKAWVNSLDVAENTRRKYTKEAKTLFGDAVDHRVIEENPFSGLPTTTIANRERRHMISVGDSLKVLEACPSARWRSIFAMARWGGLRCPSEVLAVKWGNVDWDAKTLTVPAGKTGERVVPLFPELLAVLEESHELARVGEEYIVACDSDRATANLATTMQKIIVRAGVKVWPKVFQNMRSTRETELMNKFPIHNVVDWIGNSPSVALKHYLNTTEEHLELAINHSTVEPSGDKSGVSAGVESAEMAVNRRAPK